MSRRHHQGQQLAQCILFCHVPLLRLLLPGLHELPEDLVVLDPVFVLRQSSMERDSILIHYWDAYLVQLSVGLGHGL